MLTTNEWKQNEHSRTYSDASDCGIYRVDHSPNSDATSGEKYHRRYCSARTSFVCTADAWHLDGSCSAEAEIVKWYFICIGSIIVILFIYSALSVLAALTH